MGTCSVSWGWGGGGNQWEQVEDNFPGRPFRQLCHNFRNFSKKFSSFHMNLRWNAKWALALERYKRTQVLPPMT